MSRGDRWAPPESAASPAVRFLLLALGVIVLHGAAAVCQEQAFLAPGYSFGWFHSMLEFLFYSAMPLLLRGWGLVARRPAAGWGLLLLCGLTQLLGHGFGVATLVHLNYTTNTLLKSLKVPVTVAAAWAMRNQPVSAAQGAAAACVAAGLALYVWADANTSPRFNLRGVAYAAIAVVSSSVNANLQQRVLRTGADAAWLRDELMLWQYSGAFLSAAVVAAVTGDLAGGLQWCWSAHPVRLLVIAGDILCTYLGLLLILVLARECGAPVVAAVAALRKAASFSLSFALFTKPFTVSHATATVMVAAGTAWLERAARTALPPAPCATGANREQV